MRNLIFISCLLAANATAALVDRIAVTVGNRAITLGEVLEEIRVTNFLNGEPLDFSPEARRRAADRLVDQELIRREMEMGQYPQPTDAEVDQMLAQIKNPRFRSEAEYREALQRYGVTEDALKAHLRWQIAALRFTDMRFQLGTSNQSKQASLPAPKPATGDASRMVPTPAPPVAKPQPGAKPTRASRLDAPADPAASVDDQFEAWLKQARADMRVQFKKEAFE